jgi:hypothetical protein
LGVSQSGCQARSMGKSVPRHPQLERLEASVGSTLAGWCLAYGTQAARQVQLERRGGIAIHRQHPSQKKFAPIRRPLFPTARTSLLTISELSQALAIKLP